MSILRRGPKQVSFALWTVAMGYFLLDHTVWVFITAHPKQKRSVEYIHFILRLHLSTQDYLSHKRTEENSLRSTGMRTDSSGAEIKLPFLFLPKKVITKVKASVAWKKLLEST